MSNNSFDVTATSEKAVPENNTTNTNYRRWMTDMAADIAHLKLYQLAIPGAHNSGVDADGGFNIGAKWAICQYNDFASQLAAGARYLDLRLVDSSYKKDVGGKKPTYQFKEIFEFKHGIVGVGRRLQDLVSAVNDFSTSNPGEIVFIDFHHYDRGNYSHNSLERCLPYFNSIKDRLIPSSASDLSIGEIRQKHPNCNIILCLSHNYPTPDSPVPDKWPAGVVRRDQIWLPLKHEWTSDATEENVTSLVTQSTTSPPSGYWVLSAAAGSPPIDLRVDHPIRTEAFAPGRQNTNILMVDFINGNNARTSVVDRCIELSRARGKDKSSPTAPTNLIVVPKNETIVDGQAYNTLVFSWNPSADNLGVRNYEIYLDDVLFASSGSSPYEHQNFPLKNYAFTVKGVDISNNRSGSSNRFDLVQDIIHPTAPRNFSYRSPKAYVIWSNSTDNAGMKGYEVYLNDQFLSFVTYQYNNDPYTYLPELSREEKHVIKVRAVDINDLFSEYGTFVIPVIPNLINRKIFITGYDEENEIYNACSKWEPDSEPTVGLLYHFKIDGGFIYRYFFHPGEEIIFNFQARQGQTIQTQIWTIYSEYHLKGPEDIFIFDASRPEPISNLKFTNTAQAGTSISWTPSTSTNVINYAISINEESPILIPSSVNAYTFEPLSPGKEFLIEIWALNDVDVPSALEEITIEPIDFTPPASPERPFSVPSPPPRQLPPGPPRPTMLP
ncbi:hypothetical protein PS862_05724 [Pseudomonas fluorescens]|uniref:Fibronectin type-III domain-containing protein n=2 Tax=Pseudomonas fluorescens TaxID=294 RepID=A0A5E7Q3X2_PSEFL|nr:hypothetical protein [Pseudomonas fluorescens]VVP55980.1 hypothetical protein PS862_05724 [Pseudomonas fluorescens]